MSDFPLQQAIHLHIEEKQSTRQIGRRLGWSHRTVHKHLQRAGVIRSRSEARQIQELRSGSGSRMNMAVRLYERGMNYKLAAKTAHVSVRRLKEELHRRGLMRSPQEARRNHCWNPATRHGRQRLQLVSRVGQMDADGHTVAETAEATGLTVATVKTYRRRYREFFLETA